MLEIALKLIGELTANGYKAYIVGGFVRDHLLDIESNDIDIATNATPKEIKEIFDDSCLPNEDYGSVTVIKKGIRFELTTFRKEIGYVDNRRPAEIKYIDDLYQDLLRRDFTINTICINDEGEIIDYLDGQSDLRNSIIKTVGIAKERFEEDTLRILRAIRFATILNFKLDEEVIEAIKACRSLLKNLSHYRKKEELDKIFASSNAQYGIELLLELGLDKYLELYNLEDVKCTSSLIGVWSVLDASDKYPFSSNEKELILAIREALKYNNLDPYSLYKYGLYANSVAGEIKGFDIKNITEAYNNLVIQSKKDLNISAEDILISLNREPGSFLKKIFEDIEKEVLYKRLKMRNPERNCGSDEFIKNQINYQNWILDHINLYQLHLDNTNSKIEETASIIIEYIRKKD